MSVPHTYISNWYNFQKRQQPYLKFIIIRDLRDSLISAYFSFKISHELLSPKLEEWRHKLNSMNQEEGLIYLMDEVIPRWADIQVSWLNDQALLIKYENLLADEYEGFEKIIRHCQIDISDQELEKVIKKYSFESVTNRQRGQEDISSHQRKAITGDWKNFFSEKIKQEFKRRFGHILIKTGYENDLNW